MIGRLLILVVLIGSIGAARAVEIGQGALGNVFMRGEAVRLPVNGLSVSIPWEIRDYFGAVVASGSVAPGDREIRPTLPDPGYFVATLGDPSKPIARAALAVLVPFQPSDAAHSPFGVMTHFAKNWDAAVIPLIAKAGIAHVRDEQPWRRVEKSPDSYAFDERLAGYMAALKEATRDPLIVLAFANPLHDQGLTPHTDAGFRAYAAYAEAVVKRYPELRAVEIWNEYNGDFCEGPCRSDRPGTYSRMLTVAHNALKLARPEVTVVGGAAAGVPIDYLRRLFGLGALNSMDALAIHPYVPTPEAVEAPLAALKQALAEVDRPDFPIWATEFSDFPDMRNNRDAAGRYLARIVPMMLAAGVQRTYWYLLYDWESFQGLGLLRGPDDALGKWAPSPAYVAYATLIRELDGARFVAREGDDPALRVYRFETARGPLRVIWTTRGTADLRIAADARLRVTDLVGREHAIDPVSGQALVAASIDPIYVLGGASGGVRDAAATISSATPRAALDTASEDAFSSTQGQGGWSYLAAATPILAETPANGKRLDYAPLTLEYDDVTGQPRWVLRGSPLVIGRAVMHPAARPGQALLAIRRFVSPAAGRVRIAAEFATRNPGSDGVTVLVLVDQVVRYARQIGGAAGREPVRAQIDAELAQGSTVDIVVAPGSTNQIAFDATRAVATITPIP